MKQTLPSILDSLVDKNGRITQAWLAFFQNLINAPAAISAVNVGASPFSYIASQNGLLTISGGTVSLVRLQRGVTTINTGITSGVVPMIADDVVLITYSVLPTVNFVPE